MSILIAATLIMVQGRSTTPHPVVRSLEVSGEDRRTVELSVAWPNAWRNDRNHDAAWLVVRGPDATQGVLRLADDGHSVLGGASVPARLDVSKDGCGVFVAPATEYRGDVAWKLRLKLEASAPEGTRAWAVGMVYVPAGPFELGDTHETALRFGAFHRSGEAPRTFEVKDESAIDVGTKSGDLWYATDDNRYRGDQGGPIPAAWPKGTRAFYVMKHELSQGFYAEFLSTLPAEWQARRAPLELEGEETDTCSISRGEEAFVASAPLRPCNFVTWDDTCALFDWLALRPMTEFEFEKAARGPRRSTPLDYPWGTGDWAELKRTVKPTRDLAHSSVEDEARLSDETMAELGASFYWVMDLSGSLWERVISAGHERGREFVGSHGDGLLTRDGTATNEDWPRTEGRDARGVGYRGGAEYFGDRVPDNPTNPTSPTAVRTFAGWGGAYRYKTYSARACRTAP